MTALNPANRAKAYGSKDTCFDRQQGSPSHREQVSFELVGFGCLAAFAGESHAARWKEGAGRLLNLLVET